MSKKIKFGPYAWYCPKCRRWNRIKDILQSSTYIRKCKCGYKAKLEIELRTTEKYYPIIVDAEAAN